MKKYIMKPRVTVEAFKWTGGYHQLEDPEWVVEAIKNGTIWFENQGTEQCNLMIREDWTSGYCVSAARIGDYICKDGNGRISRWDAENFEKEFELVK